MGALCATRVALCVYIRHSQPVARPSPQTDRVVALLGLLSAKPDETITLAEASRRLRVNKSTCHAMLTTLTEQSWLLRDPVHKTYRLGPALVAIARVAAQSFPALELAHSVMVDLSVQLGVSCAAVGIAEDHSEVLDQVHDPQAQNQGMRVGATIPLRPPFNAAAIAVAAPEIRDRWVGFAPNETQPHYRHALDAIRYRGFALEAVPAAAERLGELVASAGDDLPDVRGIDATSMPEAFEQIARELASHHDFLVADIEPTSRYSVIAVSAPVFDADHVPALLLSLWGFRDRLSGNDVEHVGRLLASATSDLSDILAGRRGPDAALDASVA
jgi:DNA-binding IclR family transcriptional regulator